MRDKTEHPKTEHPHAKAVLEIHAAWSRGDIEGVLDAYAEDLTYASNAGKDTCSFVIVGKRAFREFITTIAATYECTSAVDSLKLDDGKAHARIRYSMRHKSNGHAHSGTFRQVVTFHDDKIVRLQEYHDAPKLTAFRRMAGSE